MRRLLTFTLVLIIGTTGVSFADSTSEEESIVSQIKEWYASVNDGLPAFDKVDKELMDESSEGGQLSGYLKDSELVKLVSSVYGEMGKSIHEYYYWDGELFFVFTQDYQYTMPMYMEGSEVDKIIENRYYFRSDTLVRWLDSNKQKVASDQFNDKAVAIIARSADLRGYLLSEPEVSSNESIDVSSEDLAQKGEHSSEKVKTEESTIHSATDDSEKEDDNLLLVELLGVVFISGGLGFIYWRTSKNMHVDRTKKSKATAFSQVTNEHKSGNLDWSASTSTTRRRIGVKGIVIVIVLVAAVSVGGVLGVKYLAPKFGFGQPEVMYEIELVEGKPRMERDYTSRVEYKGYPYTGTVKRILDSPEWFQYYHKDGTQKEFIGNRIDGLSNYMVNELVYEFRYVDGYREGITNIFEHDTKWIDARSDRIKNGGGWEPISDEHRYAKGARVGMISYKNNKSEGLSVEFGANGDTLHKCFYENGLFAWRAFLNPKGELVQKEWKETKTDSNEASRSLSKNIDISDAPRYLRSNKFTINGGGTVSFDFHSKMNGNIRITGGKAELLGTFVMVSDQKIKISNLSAVRGVFDASNNSGTSGYIYLSEDGTLSGRIGNRNDSRDIILRPI